MEEELEELLNEYQIEDINLSPLQLDWQIWPAEEDRPDWMD